LEHKVKKLGEGLARYSVIFHEVLCMRAFTHS
jgi:hypothetical protein